MERTATKEGVVLLKGRRSRDGFAEDVWFGWKEGRKLKLGRQ
jgi:hypothetical protein